jgi:hypothetical protein
VSWRSEAEKAGLVAAAVALADAHEKRAGVPWDMRIAAEAHPEAGLVRDQAMREQRAQAAHDLEPSRQARMAE